MKHKFYLLIAFIFLILGCEIDRGKRYEHGGYYFKFLGNNSVSFCGWTESAIKNSNGVLYIPETIARFNVVEIKLSWENPDFDIKSIIVQAKIKIIPENSFSHYLKRLEEVTLPEGLTVIGKCAFMECIVLKKITLPSTLKSIEGGAFSMCSRLEAVSLPKGLTTIGGGAFSKCAALKTISLPEGLITIGSSAFRECGSLKKVKLPSTLKNIGSRAFFRSGGFFDEVISLPEGITKIGEQTFYACRSLKKITLPSTLKSIGDEAFGMCVSLKSVTFKDTSNWYVGANNTPYGSIWRSIDVSDPSINAENLKQGFWQWEKRL